MLEEKRAQIDKIDDEIVALYKQRMAVSKEIAEEKNKLGKSVTNSKREKEILNRVTECVDDDIKAYTKQVFETMFDTSKAYQLRYIDGSSPAQDKIKKVLEGGEKEFPVKASVACQGIDGAYSNIATEKIFCLSNIMYFKNFEGVFNAVEKGLCKYGVLPIENSIAGSVNTVYDLMREHNFHVVRSIKLRIQHSLLAKRGTGIDKITEIISHEQAINQCKNFLKSLGDKVKITTCANTAIAAKMVAESERLDVACISSKECMGIYGLECLKNNIQNADNNYTRFICISKDLEIYKDADRISIMMTVPHESGRLNKILNKFSTLNLNLTKLESRPLENTSFEFMFYFDFEANIREKQVLNLIGELDNEAQDFIFLGSYSEVK